MKHNIKVGILFIYSWIADGIGHFVLDGAVEDSATAEISRSQIWQWIYHQVGLGIVLLDVNVNLYNLHDLNF